MSGCAFFLLPSKRLVTGKSTLGNQWIAFLHCHVSTRKKVMLWVWKALDGLSEWLTLWLAFLLCGLSRLPCLTNVYGCEKCTMPDDDGLEQPMDCWVERITSRIFMATAFVTSSSELAFDSSQKLVWRNRVYVGARSSHAVMQLLKHWWADSVQTAAGLSELRPRPCWQILV